MPKGNRTETIKTLHEYSHPADFFYEKLPEYVSKHGVFIKVKRAFHELLGYPTGIHASRYRDRIFDIHIMSLTNALRKLEREGVVEKRSQGVWIRKGNGGRK